MEFDFRAIIAGLIFFKGIDSIVSATEWVKRFFELGVHPRWLLAVTPVAIGLIINIAGVAALGYYHSHGALAVVASIVMGFTAGFAAMNKYDDRTA